ncbi:MAG: hypothetical protein COB36_12080 [Alphaproteobacteria bacterium]|nr:MAG: hypothetical protein COB36_12080 [Alphaproteobacteria bacterium]
MKYGFGIEEYKDGLSIETLMTGDGKTQFAEAKFEDGTVSITMSYDNGIVEGVGVKTEINRIMDKDMLIKWQVKFESQGSIDSMIETLLRAKNKLSEFGKQ